MARDYGGTYGGQPRNDAQPQFPDQPCRGQQPHGQSQPEQQWQYTQPRFTASPQYTGSSQPPSSPQYPGQSQQEPQHHRPLHYGQQHPPQQYRQAQQGQQQYAPQPHYGSQQHGSQQYGPQQAPGPQASLPPESGPPASGSPRSARDLARWRRNRTTAWAIVGAGGVAALIAAVGIAQGIGPRHFSAAEKQQITDWEYGQRWRDLPAGTIFPASVSYAPPAALDDDTTLALSANRVGIGAQATCAANVDPGAAKILDSDGCSAMMRASYVDETSSFVVTVGTAVLPTSAQAAAAAKAVNAASPNPGLGPTVHAMSVAGTPAGQFGDKQRQLSGAVAEGTYVVLYTVGYADGRPKQNVPQDTYTAAEMTSMGTGIADKVLSELAAPVTPAQCPGVPGC